MDMLEYANRCMDDIQSLLLKPPATPESLNEPEPEVEQEPEHPAEDLGYATEVIRGERVA